MLQQREFMLLQHQYGADLRRYLAARPRGLTRRGVVALLERALYGGTVLDAVQMRAMDLVNPDLGHPALTWSPPAALADAVGAEPQASR